MISTSMTGNRRESNIYLRPRTARRTMPNPARYISGKLENRRRLILIKGGYCNEGCIRSNRPLRNQRLGHRVSPHADADANGAGLSTEWSRAFSRAVGPARRRVEQPGPQSQRPDG